MRVRKRYLLSAVALCCLVAAAVVHWMTRPGQPETVFDQAAWAEAVEVLKAEVGPDAVANGAYRIPRAQVAVCDAGTAMVRRQIADRPYMWSFLRQSATFRCVLLDDKGGLLVATDTRNDPAALAPRGGIAIAPLERADAQRILRVFLYLLAAQEVTGPAGQVDDRMRQRVSQAADSVLLEGGILPEGGGWAPDAVVVGRAGGAKQWAWAAGGPAQRRLKSCLAERYLNAAHVGGTLRAVRDPAEGAQAAARMLNAAADNAHYGLGGLLQWECARVVYSYPGREVEAPLRRIGRIDAAYKTCSMLARLPVLGELVNRLEMASDVRTDAGEAAALLTVVEALENKGPKERFEVAARKFLPSYVPPTRGLDCPQALIEAWPQLDRRGKLWRLRWAYLYLDSPSLAELAAADSDPIVRCHGELILFQLTGDRAHLARCLASLAESMQAPAQSRQTDQLYTDAIFRLGAVYIADPQIEEIATGFRASLADSPAPPTAQLALYRRSALADCAMVVPLLTAGGEENTEAVVRFLSSPAGDAAASAASRADVVRRGWVLSALAGNPDRRIADLLVDRLHAVGGGPGAPTRDLYALALAARGDERLLDFAGSSPASVASFLARPVMELRLRRAEDLPTEMVAIAEEGSDMQALAGAAVNALVARYSEEELMSLLADEAHVQLRGIIYIALVKRRLSEGQKP